MRTKKYDNYFQKLMTATECLDVNEMEKYISKTTLGDKTLLKKQIEKVNFLIEERFHCYGVITEEDDVEAFKKGYFDLGKISLTLIEIQKKIEKFKIETDSSMGIRISKDWNDPLFLLQDLLQLENTNLITYQSLLQKRLSESYDKIIKPKEPKKTRRIIEAKIPETPNDIIGLKDVCEMLNLSESKIYHLTCQREIPHYKLDKSKKGRLFFSRSEIENWLKQKRIGTTDEFCNQFYSK